MKLQPQQPTMIRLPEVHRVIGVDFSGARLSGVNAWIARTEVLRESGRLRLVSLTPVGQAAGDDCRDVVNAFLVDEVSRSDSALWGFDFPFGLPIELRLGPWHKQLRDAGRFDGDAKAYGHFLVDRTRQLAGALHIRRVTDRETQTPFDCYHYRIIYQTFHGMRDILRHVAPQPETCVLPFQFAKLLPGIDPPRRLVVEACPSSTLKRLGLPHRLYKQSGGKPPTDAQKMVRKQILAKVTETVDFSAAQRRVMIENPGGDALDALLAAVGVFQSISDDDHAAVAKHPRYRREGRVYG